MSDPDDSESSESKKVFSNIEEKSFAPEKYQSAEPTKHKRITAQKASKLDTEHGTRTMKVYPVTASDMKNMKLTTTYASIAFSISAGLFGYAVNIILNGIFSISFSPEAKVALYEVTPILVVCTLIFLAGGIKAQMDKNSTWNEIEKSTKYKRITASAE